VTVFGDFTMVDALAADLAAAGLEMQVKAAAIVKETAEEVHTRAVADAPERTGELKASIYNRDNVIGSDVRQAFYQEFGTSRHGPQPFLFANAERGADKMATALLVVADPL